MSSKELKNTLESLLFSTGKKMDIKELAKLAHTRDIDLVKQTLLGLKKELEEKGSSLMLFQDSDNWQLTVKDEYLQFVRKIVTKTELPKSILETLAVIAYKAPVKQSEVIKIRTNKGYDHLNELEKLGYVSRKKYGRTKLIKLTQKFYDYFDIDQEKLKQEFSKLNHLEDAKEKNSESEVKAEIFQEQTDNEQNDTH
ncbi:SMC-Scp complex subunit ScpB [Candidatus Woesearchaeota archaeon]|nr:SMC-Scp complex subunit ScpB [Candidatus Woesearchaeota archaeon]